MNPSRSRFAVLSLVPIILSLTPGESRGWSAEGHMIVALVGDRLLQARDAAAHKKLAELLATDKSNPWTKTDIASEATVHTQMIRCARRHSGERHRARSIVTK